MPWEVSPWVLSQTEHEEMQGVSSLRSLAMPRLLATCRLSGWLPRRCLVHSVCTPEVQKRPCTQAHVEPLLARNVSIENKKRAVKISPHPTTASSCVSSTDIKLSVLLVSLSGTCKMQPSSLCKISTRRHKHFKINTRAHTDTSVPTPTRTYRPERLLSLYVWDAKRRQVCMHPHTDQPTRLYVYILFCLGVFYGDTCCPASVCLLREAPSRTIVTAGPGVEEAEMKKRRSAEVENLHANTSWRALIRGSPVWMDLKRGETTSLCRYTPHSTDRSVSISF